MDDPNAPATQADIARLDQQVDQFRAEMNHQYDDLKGTLRDVKTEILKAFYGYAQTTDAKLKDGEVADIAARQRLSAVETRLLEIEKQIHLPPTQ